MSPALPAWSASLEPRGTPDPDSWHGPAVSVSTAGNPTRREREGPGASWLAGPVSGSGPLTLHSFFSGSLQPSRMKSKGTPGPQGQASRPHRVQPTPCASPTSSFLSLLGEITGHADCLTGSSPRGPLPAPLHLELVTHRALPGAWTCICADDSLQAPLMPEQVN